MTKEIIFAIDAERTAQDERWGGPHHDDSHSSRDWVAFIAKHLGKAVIWPWNGDVFRYQMIRVAALAIAAVEWIDRMRRSGSQAPNGN